VYAGIPALLGIIARGRFPDLAATNLALPMVLMRGLPPVIGALALAAVFSAEVSAADASLFMLTTSLAQDLYKRFLHPAASDDRLLTIVRRTTFATGALGVALSMMSEDVINTLTVFYTLLGVSLFVPIVAGLYVQRTSNGGAMMSIGAGVGAMLIVQGITGGAGFGLVSPAIAGLAAAIAAWLLSLCFGVR
jgi:SSS family solute:Na+ symporter